MFDSLSEKLSNAFKHIKGQHKITEANIEDTLKDVRTALLEADVNFKVVKEFIASVKEKSIGEKVISGVRPGEQFVKIMHDELARMMGTQNEELDLAKASGTSPQLIMVVGLNGAGKTTFSGKLALHVKNKHHKEVYLIPADTVRPAAKDQLITLAKNMGFDYFDSNLALHPREIALAGMKEGMKLGKSVIIIDTAGRLHVDEELMAQLKEVKVALNSFNPEVLLVADAMTGQEAVNVAKSFHESVGLTGLVLSKMDSDARGGAALSLRHVTGVPIRYISMGEKMKDLELFHPDRLAGRILDMGDVLSLVEKAQDAINEKDAERMMKNFDKNRFTIEDFMGAMDSISKIGSMESILKMIPGFGGLLRQVGDLSPAEDEMKRMKIIISSMTKKERDNYKIIDASRKKRIATGSGKSLSDVDQFLSKFKQMEQMMGGMMGMLKGGGLPGMMGNMMGGGGMPSMKGGFPGMMPPGAGGAMPGFRQQAGSGQKQKHKGKRKNPFGMRYF